MLLILTVAACQPSPPPGGGTPSGPGPAPSAPSAGGRAAGKPGHVFVINLENKGYDKVWGEGSAAPYLSKTLRAQGVLLTQYYGTDRNSATDYIAQISGQASNAMTRADCPTYAPIASTETAEFGQLQGTGCVYPESVPTLAGQLTAAGKTWKGYMEDMKTPCRHPRLGAKDGNMNAKAGDQYATRHNPFVYFTSITASPDCEKNVVDFTAMADHLKDTSHDAESRLHLPQFVQ